MTAQGRKPIWQGEMDGLCGLYAAINACNQLIRLNDEQREDLFTIGINYLDKKGQLKKTILEGMHKTHLKYLLRNFHSYIESLGKTLIVKEITKNAVNITGTWTLLTEYFASKRCVAIVGLSGNFCHWTCVVDISEKSIQLCDSCGMRRINKSACTCGVPTAKKKYSVFTGHVLGISLE